MGGCSPVLPNMPGHAGFSWVSDIRHHTFFFFKEHNNTKTIKERLFSGPHATPEIYYPRENLDTGDCSYLLEGGRQTHTLET